MKPHRAEAPKKHAALWFGTGFFFSLCLIVGRLLDRYDTIACGLGWAAAGAAILAPGVGWCFARLAGRLTSCRLHEPRMRGSPFFALCALAVFASWVPAFLGLYPGVFAYDVLAQVIQGSISPYMQNHPLLHTLIMNALLNTEAGSAAYSLCQMAIVALSIAYASCALYRAGCPVWLSLSGVFWAMLLPYHSVLAVSTTKDPLFAAAMIWLVVLLFERRFVWAVCAAVLLCLLRNNGWYALLAAAAFGGVLCQKKDLRTIAVLFTAIMLFFAANHLLVKALDAADGNTREALSVPIQQMARVVTLHPEWQEDADVQALFQGEIRYDPHLSDPVKFIFRADGETPISQVIRLWWKMLWRYPLEYVDAFLELTQGWWDVLDETHSTIYGAEAGYMHTHVLSNDLGVKRHSVIPALETLYTWLVTDNGYRRFPVLRLLFTPALWVWGLLFVLVSALVQKRHDVLLPMLVPFGLLLTMLLGPCCLVRYAYPLMLCMPFGLGALCCKPKE